MGIRVNVDMSLWISKAFQGGASNVQLLVTPDLMFEKGLNPRSKKVPQGKVWNGGYPSKLSSYLHEQRSPCCPILPFFGQDANRLGRCGSILILAISLLIALVRIHNSHQTLGPCPTSLVGHEPSMTYIYNWAIWEYPIQKEIVCMAMNQMAPGIQIFEATVC